ncbi:MAG: tetratricopeptide repeat protein [Myxococcota bacterium]|nr:tetratricopeptide repeat protein [Myxococcota bacterium]
MHRLALSGLLTVWALFAACATVKPVVRDQLIVEQLRLRITKVRNAVAETRSVIAASRGAPYLPELYMRLAELLSEEAQYHYMVAYEREQRRTKSLHVPQVRFLKEQALGTYQMILKRYPQTHLADRILFNISHEQRELGKFAEMEQTLERLVAEHLNSRYRPEALLVLGDYHFDKTAFAKAEAHYSEIVKLKESPLSGMAHYKLAWVAVNLGNCKRALTHFEKAIETERLASSAKKEALENNPVAPSVHMKSAAEFAIPQIDSDKHSFAGHKTINVQREALVDLTYCYAQERKPENAAVYLRGLAATRDAYVAALAKMANRYALIEQPRGAADVARELLRLAPDDPERLDDARMLHGALVRMKDYSVVGEDVYLILQAMRRQLLKPNLDQAAADQITNEFEMIARDLATKSHEMMVNKGGQKKSVWTKTPVAAAETARAYKAYLDVLPNTDHRLEIIENLSEVLMEDGQYLAAGHRYRETAELLRDGEKQQRARQDALYNAVVAYQQSLESEGARQHLERMAARAGLRQAGGQYLSLGKPEKAKAEKIKFAIGQAFYDEGRYLEAIDLLTALVYQYPNTEQAEASVHMVLDSYRTINDIGGLVTLGRRFLAENSPLSSEIKGQIRPIVAAAEQNRLDELSLAASGEQVGGMERLLAFADRYRNTGLGERAMLSAFVAARAGGDTAQLYSLGEEVIKRFPKSDQAAGVVGTMGRTAAGRFEFDRAIEYLERAAAMSPNQRAPLLLTAGELREQLADRDGALKNYRAAIAAAGEGPSRSAAIVHLADLIERGGTPAQVVATLRPLADPPDPEVSSRLGLALLRTGNYQEAEDFLRGVVEGATEASAAAQARANYGMAEAMLQTLKEFRPLPELDAIEEAVGLVDVVLQSYLGAARQPDPTYSQAALARLATAAEIGAQKLENIALPTELSAQERQLIEQAMKQRAIQLRADSKEALAECAQRAKASYLLDNAGRACLSGRPPERDPVQHQPLKPRKRPQGLKDLAEQRNRLSKNPEDLEALRNVGSALLNAGDAHAARLVLARTVEAGGDADDLNRLGAAAYQAGDIIGALEAFGRAKEAGSTAAVLNYAAICGELNLDGLQQAILKDAAKETKGHIIPPARELSQAASRGAK